MSRQELPEPARRAIDELRRVGPPEDLLRSVLDAAGRSPQQRSWRGQWLRLASVAAAAALVVLIAGVGLGPLGNVGTTPAPSASPTATRTPSLDDLPSAGRVEREIVVPDGAHPASALDREVWLADPERGQVLVVDTIGLEVTATIPIDPPGSGAPDLWPAVDAESGWVAGGSDRTLVRIDRATMTVQDRFAVDAEAYRIAPAPDAVWLTDFSGGEVLKVDRETGMVLARVDFPDATGIAVAGDDVWVTSYSGRVARIDSVAATLVEIGLFAPDATDLHVEDGDLWIAGINGRRLERVDPATGEVVASYGPAGSIAFLDGQVWTSAEGGLIRLDPETLRPIGAVPLPGVGTDQLVATDAGLWAFGDTEAGTRLVVVRPEGE